MIPADLEVQHHFADLPGFRCHYVEKGEGPLVVLLHGFPENWWSWRCQIDPLALAHYRVVAPDLRGYNESEPRRPYDIDTLAGDVEDLIHSLGQERAIVVGHDWGGGLAWHFAATHPGACERVAVLNAPHPAIFQKALRSNLGQIRRSWYMFFFLLPWLPEQVVRYGRGRLLRCLFYRTGDRTHFSEAELAPFFDAMLRPGAAKAAIDYYRAAVVRGLADAKSFQSYPAIRAPAMLVWGMEDRSLRYEHLVPGMEKWVPDLRIEQLPGVHHFVQYEAPDRVNALLLDFLERRSGRAP